MMTLACLVLAVAAVAADTLALACAFTVPTPRFAGVQVAVVCRVAGQVALAGAVVALALAVGR